MADCTPKANSAILHAGYDPEPGTRMARLNVEGSALAKELCARLDVPYLQCGRLVPLSLARCMRPAPPSSARGSLRCQWQKRLCETAWSCTAAAL